MVYGLLSDVLVDEFLLLSDAVDCQLHQLGLLLSHTLGLFLCLLESAETPRADDGGVGVDGLHRGLEVVRWTRISASGSGGSRLGCGRLVCDGALDDGQRHHDRVHGVHVVAELLRSFVGREQLEVCAGDSDHLDSGFLGPRGVTLEESALDEGLDCVVLDCEDTLDLGSWALSFFGWELEVPVLSNGS